MPDEGVVSRGSVPSARARILDSAYELFSRYGIRAVGVDRILESCGVAKMTLYRHFASKDELVLAFLEERRRRWTQDWLQRAIENVATDRPDRTLALFDVLDEWFHRPDFEGCSFIRTLHEIPDGPLHEQATCQLEIVRRMLADHAAQAGVGDPEAFAYQIQVLMMGAMVSALRGDLEAAKRAREIAAAWLSSDLAVRSHRS
jgi:AcrR family transcriptional regulator